jgi:hypothetical protein
VEAVARGAVAEQLVLTVVLKQLSVGNTSAATLTYSACVRKAKKDMGLGPPLSFWPSLAGPPPPECNVHLRYIREYHVVTDICGKFQFACDARTEYHGRFMTRTVLPQLYK